MYVIEVVLLLVLGQLHEALGSVAVCGSTFDELDTILSISNETSCTLPSEIGDLANLESL